MRISPLPFRREMRVVEAWARMCPPIGFLGSAWKLEEREGREGCEVKGIDST